MSSRTRRLRKTLVLISSLTLALSVAGGAAITAAPPGRSVLRVNQPELIEIMELQRNSPTSPLMRLWMTHRGDAVQLQMTKRHLEQYGLAPDRFARVGQLAAKFEKNGESMSTFFGQGAWLVFRSIDAQYYNFYTPGILIPNLRSMHGAIVYYGPVGNLQRIAVINRKLERFDEAHTIDKLLELDGRKACLNILSRIKLIQKFYEGS